MSEKNNASFIPKQNSENKKRYGENRQFFIGTFIVKIVFFASLLASVFVFLYTIHLNNILKEKVLALDKQIDSFNKSDFDRVLGFDRRLKQASLLNSNSVSFPKVLSALEKTLIESAYLLELSIETIGNNNIKVQANVVVPSFDSALFQQVVYERASEFNFITISDLRRVIVNATEGKTGSDNVQFSLESQIDTELLKNVSLEEIIFENTNTNTNTNTMATTSNEIINLEVPKETLTEEII